MRSNTLQIVRLEPVKEPDLAEVNDLDMPLGAPVK
jgi:hypothetical protein